MAFVYIIKNRINDKVYIGKTSTQSVELRFLRHQLDSTKKKYQASRVLYAAMKKYGKENFYVEELESGLTDEEACEREVYYINKYRSFIGFKDCNGYNMTPGGDGHRYADYDKIRDAFIRNNYDKKKTAKELHCSRKTVLRACKEFGLESNEKGMPKKVDMFESDSMNLIKSFDSIKDARDYINNQLHQSGWILSDKNQVDIDGYLFVVNRKKIPMKKSRRKTQMIQIGKSIINIDEIALIVTEPSIKHHYGILFKSGTWYEGFSREELLELIEQYRINTSRQTTA